MTQVDPPASQPIDIHWAVADIIHRLFHHLDEHEFGALAALFAADGVWMRQGAALQGPEGVLHAMHARPTNLRTRHLVTNLMIEGSASRCEARYYVTAFDHEGESAGPAPLALPHAIFVCADRLQRTPDGWRFAHRAPRSVFTRP